MFRELRLPHAAEAPPTIAVRAPKDLEKAVAGSFIELMNVDKSILGALEVTPYPIHLWIAPELISVMARGATPKLNCVHSLSLAVARSDDERALDACSAFPGLRTLHLTGVGASQLAAFAGLGELAALETLTYENGESLPVDVLHRLQSFPSLNRFEYECPEPTVAVACALEAHPTLRHVRIVVEGDPEAIEPLFGADNLDTLALECPTQRAPTFSPSQPVGLLGVGLKGVALSRRAMFGRDVRWLELHRPADGPLRLSAFGECDGLEAVSIGPVMDASAEIASLLHPPAAARLEGLRLRGVEELDGVLGRVAASLPRLRFLVLEGCAGLVPDFLSELRCAPRLQAVLVSGSIDATAEAAEALAAIPTLRLLDLTGTRSADADAFGALFRLRNCIVGMPPANWNMTRSWRACLTRTWLPPVPEGMR